VALVDSRNPRDCAGLVIKDFVRNMGRNAQPGHAGNAGPAQIMKAPPRQSRELIQQPFGSTEFLEGLRSGQREDIWPRLVCARQHSHRLLGQMYDVGLCVLGS
jgi:hypothetical protein